MDSASLDKWNKEVQKRGWEPIADPNSSSTPRKKTDTDKDAESKVAMDDAYLLMNRAAEFRSGYGNWRKGASKGVKGEVLDIKVEKGEGATVGEQGFRAGYKNWRKGKASGAVTKSSGVSKHSVTRNMSVTMLSAESAASAANNGENWIKFFLHPDSAFNKILDGTAEVLPICSKNLPIIAHRNKGVVTVPGYARKVDSFNGIICHMGVGGFHRSHEAMYVDKLLNMDAISEDKDDPIKKRWAIIGIGLMPWDLKMKETLEAQNCLYTLMSRSPKNNATAIIGSIVDYMYAPDDRNKVLERLANPQTKIVSLTVTEKGYCLTNGGVLDLDNAMIANDLKSPRAPQTAVGMIAESLRIRRLRGVSPFTVLSCDNLPGNGDLSRTMVIGYLQALGDPQLLAWVETYGTFPNTMVDRITPMTKDEHIDLIRATYHMRDSWPVIAEDYTQWVVEDNFVNGCRPALEASGALMVGDVHAYEMMKLRLLNAGHSALSYISYLAGHRFVDAAMTDPMVHNFIKMYFEEHTETLAPVPGVDVKDYKKSLAMRFSNPYIKDTLQRLAEDGSQKLVTTMRDPAIENIEAGREIGLFCFVVAAWIRYLVGFDSDNNPIAIKDPRGEELSAMAKEICHVEDGKPGRGLPESPKEFMTTVFGADLGSRDQAVNGVHRMLTMLLDVGANSLLELLAKDPEMFYGENRMRCTSIDGDGQDGDMFF